MTARLIPASAGAPVGYGIGPYGLGRYGEGDAFLVALTSQHDPLYCSDLDPLLCSDELECSDSGIIIASTTFAGTLVPA